MTVWIEAPFDSLPVEGYRKQRYWMMAEAFLSAGHEVVYWTSDFNHATKRKRMTRAGCAAPPFALNLLATPPYARNVCLARIRSHRAYAREWERQVTVWMKDHRRPDAIIVALPPTATGDVAIRLARRFGAKLIVDVQDAWPETFHRLLPFGFGWLGAFLFRSMRAAARRAYRAADLVTGVCDRYEAMVRAYGAKAYYRAYLGIEGTDVGETASPSRAMAARSTVRLAYVGNLGRSYDLATVVAGVHRLNAEGGVTASLDVAGFGGTVEGGAGVRFHGMLGRDELRALLADCDIGIIPMRTDSYVGVPNKLGEYAAAGLRIVSSLGGETERLLAGYGCGATYAAGDAASFAAAVRKAADLPEGASRELMRRELRAERIYRDYVKRVSGLNA